MWELGLFFGALFIFSLVQGFSEHAILVLLNRVFHDTKATILVYHRLFFAGILLHELSHFLMAKLMGVPTGRPEDLTLFPKSQKDRSQDRFR